MDLGPTILVLVTVPLIGHLVRMFSSFSKIFDIDTWVFTLGFIFIADVANVASQSDFGLTVQYWFLMDLFLVALLVGALMLRFRRVQLTHIVRGNIMDLATLLNNPALTIDPVDLNRLKLDAIKIPTPDFRVYPHNVPALAAQPHFQRCVYRFVDGTTRAVVVCVEWRTALITRAKGVNMPSRWFFEQSKLISPVNVPLELDDQLRLNSAVAACFDLEHTTMLFDRLVARDRLHLTYAQFCTCLFLILSAVLTHLIGVDIICSLAQLLLFSWAASLHSFWLRLW